MVLRTLRENAPPPRFRQVPEVLIPVPSEKSASYECPVRPDDAQSDNASAVSECRTVRTRLANPSPMHNRGF